MSEDAASLLGAYGSTLVDYLRTASEASLYRASRLSSAFIEAGLGPEEIVAVHTEQVEQVTLQAPARDRARLYANSLQFLLEIMIAYGIRYKEYVDLKIDEQARIATERRHTEEARLRLAAIIDSSAEAIIGITLDGAI